MRRKIAIASSILLAVLCLFSVVSATFVRTNSFCRPGCAFFCPGYDFTLRMNEVGCLRHGVNPFLVWNEDVELEPYISSVPKKDSYDKRFCEPVNAYTPWGYSMALPLSFLPRDAQWAVYFVFMFVCVGVVFFCGYKAGFSVRGDMWDGVLTASAPLVLSFYPIWSNLSLGNYSVVILAALALMAHFLNRGRDVLAGLCWSVAMIKPQMALLFAVPLLWRRKFLTCTVAAAACIVLAVPPSLMCGTSPIDLILQAPAASAHGFNGCGTFPYFLCGFVGRSAGIYYGLLVGVVACVVMTWLVKERRDWLAFFMPAAVCSMSWTYSQMFTYALGWFVFAALALEFAKGHCTRELSCLSALSIVLFARVGRVAQCVLMVVGGGCAGFLLSKDMTWHIDSVNSALSLLVAFALCLSLAMGDSRFVHIRAGLASKTAREFIRYIVVGGLAFVADVGTLIFCREKLFPDWSGGVYLSVLLAFLAGHVVNYVGSLCFVFRDPEERRNGLTWRAFWLFALVGASGAGATELGMWIGYGLLHMNYIFTKVLVAAVVFVWNFVGRKLVVKNKNGR